MNVGDKVTIPFGKGTKEGTVERVFDKSIWVKVDFPRQPGKLVRRKVNDLQNVAAKGKKKGTRKSK
jgi:hypothetical protein